MQKVNEGQNPRKVVRKMIRSAFNDIRSEGFGFGEIAVQGGLVCFCFFAVPFIVVLMLL